MSTHQAERWIEMVPGIRRRTLVSGDGMMQMLVQLDADAIMPVHQHPHEQIAYVLRGRLRFQIGEETRELAAGDALLIPGNMPHGVEVLEATLVLDSFSPPREDLLAQDQALAETE